MFGEQSSAERRLEQVAERAGEKPEYIIGLVARVLAKRSREELDAAIRALNELVLNAEPPHVDREAIRKAVYRGKRRKPKQ